MSENVNWHQRAIKEHNSGFYKEAIESYGKHLSEEPNDADCLGNLAACYYSMGNTGRATKIAKSALRNDPDHLHSLKILALIDAQERRIKHALVGADRVAKLAPEDSATFKFKADVEMELGLALRAEQSILEAIRLSAEDDRLHNRLASIQLALGKPQDAERSLLSALRLNPNSVESLGLLGVVQRYTGRTDDSYKTLRSALQIDPNEFENRTQLLNAIRSKFPPFRWGLNAITRSASISAKFWLVISAIIFASLRAWFSAYQSTHGNLAALSIAGFFIVIFSSPLIITTLIDAVIIRSKNFAIFFSPVQRGLIHLVTLSLPLIAVHYWAFDGWSWAHWGRLLILLFCTTFGSSISVLWNSKRAMYVGIGFSVFGMIAATIVTLVGGQAVS
ncbi:MAG TPA: tetratricopeptide repeat protein [Fimbriimonas sp.]|nr:tetratricopeptide repeat protein [Fimbriimonas sp.]